MNSIFKVKTEKNQIKYVRDRAGHDKVYKINSNKIKKLGWKHKIKLNTGLSKTINYYIKNLK